MENREKVLLNKPLLAKELHKPEVSPINRYRAKVLGDDPLLPFLRYELAILLFGNLSGGIGYLLRKWFYQPLFKSAGNGTILGKGIVLRHPGRVSVGHRVAIDDYTMLDASGAGEEGIVMGDDIIISRNCVIQGKSGPVTIGDKTDIGCNTIISSTNGVHIGRSVLIAGNCYIGGGRYYSQHPGAPMIEQGLYSEGPVIIGDDVWLGAGVIVPDGRRVGNGCIVGAGAVVTKDLPDYSIAYGIPATVRGYRGQGAQKNTQTLK
jgi:acetyltransferase-like isoleucine patch superfamily enzyme